MTYYNLEYLPSLVKYGVNSKIACQLVRLGILRTDAVKISNAYREKAQKIELDDEEPQSFDDDFSETIIFLDVLTDQKLRELYVDEETIKKVSEIRERYKKETSDVEPEFPPSEYFEPSG
jgi:hypothetical protein